VSASSYAGGLVGYGEGASNVTNSFWDTQTSGQVTSDGGTGKATAEMQDISTFSNVGWSISAVAYVGPPTNEGPIWNIIDGETYPFLRMLPFPEDY
jgi:hypothetical protein